MNQSLIRVTNDSAVLMSHINSLKEELRKQKAITEMWYERQLFYKWCFYRLNETSQKNLKKVYELETGKEVNFE